MKSPCECCQKNEPVGVACIPGVPMSISWCRPCLDADIIPYEIAVMQTALLGGLEHTIIEWQELVVRTCQYFDVPLPRFHNDVRLEMIEQDNIDYGPDEFDEDLYINAAEADGQAIAEAKAQAQAGVVVGAAY